VDLDLALAARDLLMAERDPSSDRLWLGFAVSSVAFLAVLAISPVKDYFREYRGYQHAYRERLLATAGSSKELKAAQAESVQIRQVWLRELDGRVDRCTSCHLGVDETRMADAPQPFRLHPPTPHTPEDLQRFGCVSCHRGQGRATTREAAHGEVAEWNSPLLPLPYTEASCGTCHLGETVPEAALLSAGRRLMRRAGCFGCHQLAGQDDGWRSDAPDLSGLAEKTYPEWLRAWLKDPKSLRPGTWMPGFHLADDEIEDLTAYLWVQPPLSKLSDEGGAEPPPGDFDRGKTLFRESRCISCHTVEGRGNGSAPELSGVGSKVNRKWLIAFLADPHAFQPATAMPRYHFSRQDLLDVSQYMVEDLTDPAAPAPGGSYHPAVRSVESGEALYRKYGCGGCHDLGGRGETTRIGPELTGIGGKPVAQLDFGHRDDLPRRLPDWLAAKVTQPRSFRDDLKMPEFGFDDGQVEALVTALLAATGESLPPAYTVPAVRASYSPPGRFGELVRRYRCLSCHQVQGTGGDISTAPLTAEGSKVQAEWLRRYLLHPSAIRPILTDRMVPLRMRDDEAARLADFIDNVYVDDSIPGEIFPGGPPPERAERGRKLFFERYGCQACHQVGGAGGYYGPPLDETPGKLESGWIAWWLQGPQRWRADVRCPNYGLDEADAQDLAAFLSALPAGKGGGS
jgi:mono/diheme cytochrome c family protein